MLELRPSIIEADWWNVYNDDQFVDGPFRERSYALAALARQLKPLPNNHGSSGYTAVGNTIVSHIDGRNVIVARLDSHWEAVNTVLQIGPYIHE